MIYIKYTNTILILLLFCYSCSCYLHKDLYRVVPSYNFKDYEVDIGSKAVKLSSHKLATLMKFDLSGKLNSGYYISLGIGTPPQQFNFIIDTGSSNFAVAGVPQDYISRFFDSRKSSTFMDHSLHVTLQYESGSWEGLLSSDIITLDGAISVGNRETNGPLKINSNFTLIKSSKTFFMRSSNWEGILGLAYPALSHPYNVVNRNTLFDDLVLSTSIPDMFSIVLCGHRKENSYGQTHGYFIAGGINQSLFEPPLMNIMIRRKWFYEILISSISVSNTPIMLSSCIEYNNDKTILDTGTSDTLLPIKVFRSLTLAIINNMQPHPFPLYESSLFWDRKAVLCISARNRIPPHVFFPEINFNLVINDTASLRVALSPQQYIAYVGDQMDMFGNVRNCYKFGFGLSRMGTILGDSFMEGFYMVFYRANNTVAMAQSNCNDHYPGVTRSRILGVETGQRGLLSCGVKNDLSGGLLNFFTSSVTLTIGLCVGIVILAVLTVVLVIQLRGDNDPEYLDLLHPAQNVPRTVQYKSFD